jgi:hypothetical protein
MDIPDVSGYRLEQALALLKKQGFEKTEVRLTASPRLREAGFDGGARVVRQSEAEDGTIVLLVCNMKV